jgi:PadR family transcriptional regulator, regulatory protein PadR
VADVLGTFEQAVLLALLHPISELGKERYGRAVLKEVQLRLDREVSAGAVYSTLTRLETKGLVRSEVKEGTQARGGLPRRYYAVTKDGIQALNDAAAVVDRLWSGVRTPLRETR